MSMFRVMWEIDIEARSFAEAARKAREIQQRPHNIANYFEVRKRVGESWNHTQVKFVDLNKGKPE